VLESGKKYPFPYPRFNQQSLVKFVDFF
jgi:hypothetical protein